MSIAKGFPLPRANRAAVTPYQKNLVNKIAEYMKGMQVDKLGTFTAPNLYDINDYTSPILPNGLLKEPLHVKFGIYRITDSNIKSETGRKTNYSSGARELFDGTTISYAVVPLEDLDKNGKPNFVNIPDVNGATQVFDPRLVALSTYPREISDIAGAEKALESRDFNNAFQTINTDNEYIPFSPRDYYKGLLEAVLNANPHLLDNAASATQEEE